MPKFARFRANWTRFRTISAIQGPNLRGFAPFQLKIPCLRVQQAFFKHVSWNVTFPKICPTPLTEEMHPDKQCPCSLFPSACSVKRARPPILPPNHHSSNLRLNLASFSISSVSTERVPPNLSGLKQDSKILQDSKSFIIWKVLCGRSFIKYPPKLVTLGCHIGDEKVSVLYWKGAGKLVRAQTIRTGIEIHHNPEGPVRLQLQKLPL